MREMNEDSGAHTALTFQGAPPPRTVGRNQGRRALPSEAEQKRRQEWGRKWGKLVSEAVREAMKGAE